MGEIRFSAAVFTSPGRLEVQDVAVPEPAADQVLVRISACGICGSDLNIFHRDPPIPKYWAGHEMSGVVAAANGGAFAVGDLVTISPLIACGECAECASGRQNVCSRCLFMSFNLPGGFAQYVVAPAGNVHRIPAGRPAEEGVLAEPLAVVVHALAMVEGIRGKRIVVVGSGTIGLLAVNAARTLGAGRIVAVGKHAFQRDLALGLGADASFAPAEAGFVDASVRAFGGERADVVMETVGGYGSASIAQAIDLLRPGGTILLSGVHYKTPEMNLKYLTERELILRGSQRYRPEDFVAALQLLAGGRIQTDRLITHRVGLREIMNGYDIAFRKATTRAVKVIICP